MRSGQAQRARISCKNLRRNFAAKSSFKTRQKSSKDQKAAAKSSRQNSSRKFLGVKSLWIGRDLNLRQIFQAKFYAKICIKPAKFIVNFSERFSRLIKFPARSPFLARSVWFKARRRRPSAAQAPRSRCKHLPERFRAAPCRARPWRSGSAPCRLWWN